jgi:hypothetical protein
MVLAGVERDPHLVELAQLHIAWYSKDDREAARQELARDFVGELEAPDEETIRHVTEVGEKE